MDAKTSTEDRRSVSPTTEPPQAAQPNNPGVRVKHLRGTSLRLADKADALCKKLKRSADHTSNYWNNLATIHQLQSSSSQYELECEQTKYVSAGGQLEEFLGLEKTAKIKDAIDAHDRAREKYRRHQVRLENSSSISRTFMGLFLTSQRGLDINAGMGPRARKDQRNFHRNLIKDYDLTAKDATEPDKRNYLWSVAQGDWAPKRDLRAAHMYPYSWGAQRMTELFGEECAGELFSSRNGLLLPFCIEEAMTDWAIVIVPNIEDNPSPELVEEWINTTPREYKFRVLDPSHSSLDVSMLCRSGAEVRGKDLDQVQLRFRGDERPRARYLWFWFACAVLRRFWATDPRKAGPILAPQLGKGMWGTKGAYMRKDFILGIVEEIGHEAAFLLDGARPATSPDDEDPNPAIVDLVNQDIAARATRDTEEESLDYVDNIENGSEEDAEEGYSDTEGEDLGDLGDL